MKRSDPRRGVILVTVLWSIALLSALAMAASVTFRGFAGVMSEPHSRPEARSHTRTAGIRSADDQWRGRDLTNAKLLR